MGKVLKFGRNAKNYKLPVSKTGKEPKAGVFSGHVEAVKVLRESFTKAEIAQIEAEIEAEVAANEEGQD